MIRITITSEDGRAFSYDVDDYHMSAEFGVAMVPTEFGQQKPTSNGQFRMLLTAWKGCRGYEHFTTEAPDPSHFAKVPVVDPGCGGKHPAGAICPFCNPSPESI